LPHKFCIVAAEFQAGRNWAYGFHCTGCPKTVESSFTLEVVTSHEAAKAPWLKTRISWS
jgi:hypothetical protein